jgi:hypothetical protein
MDDLHILDVACTDTAEMYSFFSVCNYKNEAVCRLKSELQYRLRTLFPHFDHF